MSDTRRDRQLGLEPPLPRQLNPQQQADWLDLVQRQICPLCGAGPFTVVSIHVAKRHGVDRFWLRDMLGVTYTRVSLCDPAHSRVCAATVEAKLGGKRPDTTTERKAPTYSKAAKDRLRDLSAAQAARHRAETAERDEAIAALVRANAHSYREIGAMFGVDQQTIGNVARRAGIPPRPGRQPIREKRTCSIEGCDRVHKGHGLCRPHLRAMADRLGD